MYGIKCDICGKNLTSDITYYSLGDCKHCTCVSCIANYRKLNNLTFRDALKEMSKPYRKDDNDENKDSC